MTRIPAEMIPELKDLYAFRSLSDQEINYIAANAELYELEEGDKLFVTDGEYAPFYMVISGRVHLKEESAGSAGQSSD